MTTTQPEPTRVAPCHEREDDAERIHKLRRLRDGLHRNTTAVSRIIDELIREIEREQGRDAA